MAGTPTTVYQFTTLDGNDNNDSVAAVNGLAGQLDGLLLPRTLTTAQRDALSGGRRPLGLIVNNSTTGRLERWDGSAWRAVSPVSGRVAGGVYATGGLSVSFPVAFASAPAVVVNSEGSSATYSLRAVSVTASGFKVLSLDASSNQQGNGTGMDTFSWVATEV